MIINEDSVKREDLFCNTRIRIAYKKIYKQFYTSKSMSSLMKKSSREKTFVPTLEAVYHIQIFINNFTPVNL